MNTTKKLFSVLVASLLLVACVVGMLIVGANAADPITLTVDGVGGQTGTYATVKEALAAAKGMTWAEDSNLTIVLATNAVDVPTGSLLFDAQTIWAGNKRLPITIKGATGTEKLDIDGRITKIACANSYTFENLVFDICDNTNLQFYAGSGEVTFRGKGVLGNGTTLAWLGADSHNADCFAGWENHLPSNGEKIVTSLTFDGVNCLSNVANKLYAAVVCNYNGDVTPDMVHSKLFFKNEAVIGTLWKTHGSKCEYDYDISIIAENCYVPGFWINGIETKGDVTLSFTDCEGVSVSNFLRNRHDGDITVTLDDSQFSGEFYPANGYNSGLPENYTLTLDMKNGSSFGGKIEVNPGTASTGGNYVLKMDSESSCGGAVVVSAGSANSVSADIKNSTLNGDLSLYSGSAGGAITATSTSLKLDNVTVKGKIRPVQNDADVTSPLTMKLNDCVNAATSYGIQILDNADQKWTGNVEIEISGEKSIFDHIYPAYGVGSVIEGNLDLEISGGTFAKDIEMGYGSAESATGTTGTVRLDISGGTFNGAVSLGRYFKANGLATVEISGGTFNSDVYAGYRLMADFVGTKATISGGTFNKSLMIGSYSGQQAPLSFTIQGTPVFSETCTPLTVKGNRGFTGLYDADITYPEEFYLAGDWVVGAIDLTVKKGTFGKTNVTGRVEGTANTFETTIEGGTFNGQLCLGTQSGVVDTITNTITGGTFNKPVICGNEAGTVNSISNTITGGIITVNDNGLVCGNHAGTVGTIKNDISGGTVAGHAVLGSNQGNVRSIESKVYGDFAVGRNFFGGNGYNAAQEVGSIYTHIYGNASIGYRIEGYDNYATGCFFGGSRGGTVTGTITTVIDGGRVNGMYGDMYEGTHNAATTTTVTGGTFSQTVTAAAYLVTSTNDISLILDLTEAENIITFANTNGLVVRGSAYDSGTGKVQIFAGAGKIQLNNAVTILADEVTGGAVNVEFTAEPNVDQIYIIAPDETQYVVLNEGEAYAAYAKDGDLVAGVEVQPVDAVYGVNFNLGQDRLAVNLFLTKEVDTIENFVLQVTFKGAPLAVGTLEDVGDLYKVSLGEFNASDFDAAITIAAEGMVPYEISLMDVADYGIQYYSDPEHEDPEMVALMKAIYTYGYQASMEFDGDVDVEVNDDYLVSSTGDYTGRGNVTNNVEGSAFSIDGLALVLENEVGYRIYSTAVIPENYEVWVAGVKLEGLEMEAVEKEENGVVYYSTFAFSVNAVTMVKDIVIEVRVDGETAASATLSIPAACMFYLDEANASYGMAEMADAILAYIEAVELYCY